MVNKMFFFVFLSMVLHIANAVSVYPSIPSLRKNGIDQNKFGNCAASALVVGIEHTMEKEGMPVKLSNIYSSAFFANEYYKKSYGGTEYSKDNQDFVKNKEQFIPSYLFPEDMFYLKSSIIDSAIPKLKFFLNKDELPPRYSYSKDSFGDNLSLSTDEGFLEKIKSHLDKKDIVTLTIDSRMLSLFNEDTGLLEFTNEINSGVSSESFNMIQDVYRDKLAQKGENLTVGDIVRSVSFKFTEKSSQKLQKKWKEILGEPHHAVAVVGYDDSLYKGWGFQNNGAIIVKNTWNRARSKENYFKYKYKKSLLGKKIGKSPLVEYYLIAHSLEQFRFKISNENLSGYYAIPYQLLFDIDKKYRTLNIASVDFDKLYLFYKKNELKHSIYSLPFACGEGKAKGMEVVKSFISLSNEIKTIRDDSQSFDILGKLFHLVSKEMDDREESVFQIAQINGQDGIGSFYKGEVKNFYCPGSDIFPSRDFYDRSDFLRKVSQNGVEVNSDRFWYLFLFELSKFYNIKSDHRDYKEIPGFYQIYKTRKKIEKNIYNLKHEKFLREVCNKHKQEEVAMEFATDTFIDSCYEENYKCLKYQKCKPSERTVDFNSLCSFISGTGHSNKKGQEVSRCRFGPATQFAPILKGDYDRVVSLIGHLDSISEKEKFTLLKGLEEWTYTKGRFSSEKIKYFSNEEIQVLSRDDGWKIIDHIGKKLGVLRLCFIAKVFDRSKKLGNEQDEILWIAPGDLDCDENCGVSNPECTLNYIREKINGKRR